MAGCSNSPENISALQYDCNPFNLTPFPRMKSEQTAYSLSEQIFSELEAIKHQQPSASNLSDKKKASPVLHINIKNSTEGEELYIGKRMIYSVGYNVKYSCNDTPANPHYTITGTFSNDNGKAVYNLSLSDRKNVISNYTSS